MENKIIKPLTCQATSNKTITIPDAKSYIVLYFYPKDATPGCTKEGLDFSHYYENFLATNTLIYGVSRDSLKHHENFKEKQKFPFELIADEKEELCQLFDVIKFKKLYGRKYLGIVRSTFIIAPDGKVLKHWPHVKVKGHAKLVLDFVETL